MAKTEEKDVKQVELTEEQIVELSQIQKEVDTVKESKLRKLGYKIKNADWKGLAKKAGLVLAGAVAGAGAIVLSSMGKDDEDDETEDDLEYVEENEPEMADEDTFEEFEEG